MKNIRLVVLLLAMIPGINAAAQKKPLDHSVYDTWQSAGAINLSNNGKILSYQISEQEGDSRLIVRNLSTNNEITVERGTAFKMAEDASYAVCTIKAPYKETRQAKIDKKKKEEMPKDTLAYINLNTLEVTKFSDFSSVKMGFDKNPYIFISKDIKDVKEAKNLLVLTPSTGSVDTIKNVSAFEVSKAGDKVAVITAKHKKDSLSKNSVVLYNIAMGKCDELSEGKKEYASLIFNNEGDKLMFTATDEEEKKNGTPSHSIYLSCEKVIAKATRKSPAKTEISTVEIVKQNTGDAPEGWIVTKNSRPQFSNKSSRIILSLNKHIPAKDTTVVDFEAAGLDIWRWDAQTVPPMDKVSRMRETLTAIVNLDNPSLITLSGNPNERISFTDGGDGDKAYSSDGGKYILDNMWADIRVSDMYSINLTDGSRTLLQEKMAGSARVSKDGKHAVWFSQEDGNWWSWNLENGERYNLTAQTGVNFYDEDDDHPMAYTSYSTAIFDDRGENIFVNDKYDVWKINLDGKKAENLTKSEGRNKGIQFRMNYLLTLKSNPFLYQNDMTIPSKGKLYLTSFDENTKMNGIGSVNTASPQVPQYFTDKYTFSSLVKAKNGSEIAFLKGNFQNPMDIHVTSDEFKTQTRLSAINPQQKDYIWGDVQLVHWNAYDGTKLDGLLYTPENLDPSQKYPMMIYFYEKNSETLYNYKAPAPSRSIINIAFFASRGYVVFVPDIVYTPGHPGESAYNCICSGAEAMCEQFKFINKDKMAIQGQSWGGYQTAYLVTRTNMFAAGGAGAPVGNMTSAYGGIRWESGNSRITQYEHGQSRIGKTLWEEGGLDLYIENSPVFFAPNCTTPVLIMHNDADGAVPWYQGIEFFMSLRRLGKPAWLLEYNDEAHNLVQRRNCKDLSIRLSQFFDHYLKGEPMPVWMKSGIPFERKGNYFATEYAE